MTDRNHIFENLKTRLQNVGFKFQKNQQPYLQNRKENELVFEHPDLLNKFEQSGFSVKAKKFYIKPLSDDENCEIGFVTGKTTPLYKINNFISPNTKDSFDNNLAWTNNDKDNALDKLLIQISDYINDQKIDSGAVYNTYLLTWNPLKWDWKELKNQIEYLNQRGTAEDRWSCGNSKSIRKGDRIFLTRLGNEPRGIFASGYALTPPYPDIHWNEQTGKTTNYINIEFDVLLDPESDQIFGQEFIEKIDPKKIQHWFPQQSGISINSEIVDSLETSWFDFIYKNRRVRKNFLKNSYRKDLNKTYFEGKSKEVSLTLFERNPAARKKSLEYHGFSCKICGFNFEESFGEVGRGFIHVHHINPISTRAQEYEINPIEDLIPVCPNCHAMIHSKIPAYSIEEIKNIRQIN